MYVKASTNLYVMFNGRYSRHNGQHTIVHFNAQVKDFVGHFQIAFNRTACSYIEIDVTIVQTINTIQIINF